MRWLVTGANGMLGRELRGVLAEAGETEVSALARADLDLLDRAALADAVTGHDVVINAAAWTDVDGAEADEVAATAVNGHAVADLADLCAASGAFLIQVSTDYVFAGDATSPYPESAPTAPLNAYGRGKLVAERAVLETLPGRGYVVRTAWLYGAHGKNFVATMLRLAAQRETVEVVADQEGQPTWTHGLAAQLVALAGRAVAGEAEPGVYHGTATGQTSWYGLARAVFEEAGLDPERVRPITTDRFPRPAPRPRYSVLGHDRWTLAGLPALPDWRDMLSSALPRFDPALIRSAQRAPQ
ncbi:dTDP-4-dehydrorhamnose reductase [Rugosimonospora acidiphila]|uniref:dTDP-4-dehydrorhamnose reductase n=1 Tax=Rugosimonospora acidiphila TaxID=556531 RepID=A0ABP9RNI4_9ACTN